MTPNVNGKRGTRIISSVIQKAWRIKEILKCTEKELDRLRNE